MVLIAENFLLLGAEGLALRVVVVANLERQLLAYRLLRSRQHHRMTQIDRLVFEEASYLKTTTL